MLLFDSDVPLIWWTFEDIDTLEDNQEDWEFGGRVFKLDELPSAALRTDEISFDPPESWGKETNASIVFKKTSNQELYQARDVASEWAALRKDTTTHVWLFGNYKDRLGKGVFILCIPHRG
jgi:hypothetical protein